MPFLNATCDAWNAAPFYVQILRHTYYTEAEVYYKAHTNIWLDYCMYNANLVRASAIDWLLS